jgi:type II secretion system protein D
MTLRQIQRALRVWLVISFVVGFTSSAAQAQSPKPPAEPPTEKTATTQPAKPTDTQAASEDALANLIRMRDELKKKEAEAAATQEKPETPPKIAPRQPARPSDEDEARDTTKRDRRPQTIEELRQRAQLSTRPGRGAQPTRGADERDFMGPPETLKNDAPQAQPEPEPRERKPVDQDENWFNFTQTPWEDVVQVFAERIGKPLMEEDLIIGGTLTYQSDRIFTKQEAIDELNLIMHESGYRFVEREHHIFVVPLSEMPQWVPLDRVFPTVADFEKANPRDMEYVTVYYRVPDLKAQAYVDMFGDALPDYSRLSALDESNQIKIVSLAKDVRKFLTLKDMIDISPSDPRELRFFDIQTNASDIEQLVRDFMNLPSSRPQIRMERRGNRMVPVRVGGDESTQTEVQMVADERTNSIIVKASKDQMEEIAELIEQFDKKPEIGEFDTRAIKVHHVDATEVANLLNQIFQQEQGQSARAPSWQRIRQLQRAQRARGRNTRGRPPARTNQPQGTAPEDIITEGVFERARKTVRLVAYPEQNVLFVYANDEGHQRVRALLDEIDQPEPDNFEIITLENADVADVEPTLTQLVNGLMAQTLRGGRAAGPNIVADPAKNAFYVVAETEEMARIKNFVAELDVPQPEQTRHIVRLEKLRPSAVASMVQSLLAEGSPNVASRFPSRRGRRGRVPTSLTQGTDYQVIPLDDAQILIVICTDEDWERIESTIQLWEENALSNTPQVASFTLENADADAVAENLANMYRRYSHPVLGNSQVYVQADGSNVIVYAVEPAIEEIGALLEVLDIKDESGKVEILPLAHADANTVASQLQSIYRTSGRRGRGGSTGPMIQAEPVTNALIVQAKPGDLEDIKDFAMRIDQEVAAQAPERKFFTLRYATPNDVARAVLQLYQGVGRRRGTPVGQQIKVVAADAQVIVEAPADKMQEIDAFIQQLDDPQGKEIVIETIKLAGSDVGTIASKLNNAFRARPNVTARFDPDTQAETILLTISKSALEEAKSLISQYVEAAEGVAPQVKFVQLNRAQAQEAAQWLRDQLITYMQQQLGRRAASMIKVTADSRTNRVVINGPEVAVVHGEKLLEQYDADIDSEFVSPLRTEARKLPGLDVRALAQSLDRTFRDEARQRPDRLRASFQADELTQTIIISAPQDMYDRINEIVATFEEEAEETVVEQEFIEIKEADANYIANQVRGLLSQYVSKRRGRRAAQDISIGVDTRMNRLTVSAPRFAIDLANELVAKLDVPPLEKEELRTITLDNADAGTVNNILRQIFDEKIRAKSLQISVEPLTNSLIVGGSDEDYAQIEKWATDLDEKAVGKKGQLQIIDVLNANPWEVANILNAQYGGGGWGRRRKIGQEYSFIVLGGRALVIQAPEEKMPEILELVERLDSSDVERVEVRVYELPGIGRDIRTLAREVTNAMNQTIEQRERRVSIAPYEEADALIVTARTDQFEEIEKFIDKFKPLIERETTVTRFIELEYLDAARSAGEIQNMLASKLSRTGRSSRAIQNLSITPDPRTNRLICFVPDKIVADLEEVVAFLDVPPTINEGEIRTIPLSYADANTVANILRPMFQQRSQNRRNRDFSEIQVQIQPEPITNALLVTASEEDFAQIEARAIAIDEGAIVNKAEPELIRIEYANPHELRGVIQTSFQTTGRGQGRRFAEQEEVAVQVIGSNLLVQAPKDKLAEVKALIAQLDVVETDDLPVTIALEYVDPNQMAQTINAMFQTRERGRQQDLQVTVTNGQLVVKAPKQKLDQIQSLVAELDQEDQSGLQVRTYQLKVLNATMVAGQVQAFLRQMMPSQRRGQMQPGAFPEPTTNTLVIVAPPRHLPFIETLINELENADMPESNAKTYALRNVRAEQVGQSVSTMLNAKIAEVEGQRARQVQNQVAVVPESASNRLFVYAPERYQELADQLIAMIDEEVENTDTVHIITLEQGDAQEIARSIQQMIQGLGSQRGSAGARAGAATVRVTADIGSNSIILGGMARDIAEVEGWIHELETNSIDVPELQVFDLVNASPVNVQSIVSGMFGPSRNPREQVSITVEDYGDRLYVTANKRKMREVEKVIELLDREPETTSLFADGRELNFVTINRGSASDIAWDVRDLLDDRPGGPEVEADWYGEYIRVLCRPADFPKILDLIRQFERLSKEEKVVRMYDPKGRDASALIAYLRDRGEEFEFIEPEEKRKEETLVEYLWPEGEEPPAVRERRERNERENDGDREPSREVPRTPYRTGAKVTDEVLEAFVTDIFGDGSPGDSGSHALVRVSETRSKADRPARKAARKAVAGALHVRPVSYEMPDESARGMDDEPPATRSAGGAVPSAAAEPAKTPDDTGTSIDSPVEKIPVRIVQQADGTFLIEGPTDEVDDVTMALDLITEDLATGEVIRIFKFRYGDVTAAAEVLSIMFDVRQRQIVVPQQQQQRRGQQQGKEEDDRRGGGIMQQFQNIVGGRSQRGGRDSGPALRIATDPGHNYLIIKCDEVYLPEIRQLLRELDIPPGEVGVKIFQLRNLTAEEAAQNIQDVLGISKVQQRRGRQTPSRGRGRGNQQQQLMEMLQQQMVSVPGVEGGAKVERVEIVPNSVTNSLLVSAPPEVMGVIENLIEEMEGLEGLHTVGIHHYKLDNTRVSDILPLLQQVFEGAGGGGGRGGRGGGGQSPSTLGPVTISSDPYHNTIIFTAEAKDVSVVEQQISMLDTRDAIAGVEMYVCQYGDAEQIAAVVSALFATGGGGQQRGRRGGPATEDSIEVRIEPDAATNSISVWGPIVKRDEIFQRVEELDLLAERRIREIDVVYADPEGLAATLMDMFGNTTAGASRSQRGRRGGQRGGGGGVMSSERVTILGDKDAKKVIVRAPEHIFEEIVDLVTTLDRPSEQLKLKRFELVHADAEGVVQSVRDALTEYMQLSRAQGDDADFDAFTAMPDSRTNSVVVVGSEETFLFVEQVIAAVDVETPEMQRKDFRIFTLEKANATIVADAINGYATGGTDGGGGRRGPRGGAAGGAREINVYALADEGTNSVMVFGRLEDIELVETAVIRQYEDSLDDLMQIETIPVANVPPSEIVNFVWQFLDVGAEQTSSRGRGGRRSGGQTGTDNRPQIVPNDANKTLVVRGTQRQIDEIRSLVERFDNKDFTDRTIKVVEVPYGQDALQLATEVERVVNESEAQFAEQRGMEPRQITVGADAYTNTLIIAGDPTLFGRAESIINQLGEVRSDTAVTRVIQLRNLSAEDAQEVIERLQDQRRGGSSSGSRRSTPSRRSGSRRTGRRSELPAHLRPPQPASTTPLVVRPAAWVEPYVGTSTLSPVIALLQGMQDPSQSSAKDDDEKKAPRKRAADDSRRARLRDAQEKVMRDVERELGRQPADAKPGEIVDTLSGVSGALRGEVSANAIDSRQIIITGDQDDVDFIEQILLMMEQTAEEAMIQVFTLENAKATALAPILETAIEAKIEARTSSPGPQDRFSINAEGRSNSLIVSASEGTMEDIALLIDELDVPDAGGGSTASTVPLRYVRAAEAVTILRPVIEELNQMRDVPSESQATIRAIERSNSVMIVGTPQDVEEISDMIQAVDVELTEDDEQTSFVRADVILIPLINAQAENVAETLTDMIEEQQEAAREADGEQAGEPFVKVLQLRLPGGEELPPIDLDRPIKILPEEGTNSLIIFSSAKNNEALARLVQVFDTLPMGAETDVKAFVLQHASAEQVAELLQEIFDEDKYLARPSDGKDGGIDDGVLPPLPPGMAAKGLPYPLLVQSDVRSNTVIVIGRTDAVVLAGGLISELDRPTTDLGVRAFVLELREMQASAMADKLSEMLDDRASALGADDNEARDSAVIVPEERSNSLIIFASEQTYDMIEELVLRLDAASKYSIVDLRFRPLKHADALKLQELIEELFDNKQSAEQDVNDELNDSLYVAADPRTNALLLTGTRDYLEEAEQLILQLDRPYDGSVEFHVQAVRLNSAANIAALLRDMIDEALAEEESQLSGTPIYIAADPLSDSLLIAASKDDMPRVLRWVEILDRPSEIGRMARIIPLTRGDAETVATAVNDIFQNRGGDTGEVDLTITADQSTNSVVVFGPPALVQEVDSFVTKLDTTEPGKGAMVRVFRLQQAAAEDAADLLDQVLEGQDTDNQVMLIFQKDNPEIGQETLRAMKNEVVVRPDPRTNALIVTAPPDSMPMMEALIEAIDMSPDTARIRVFQLVNADAEQMVEMLQELFERDTVGPEDEEIRRMLALENLDALGRQEIAFTTDVRTNAIIAAGTPGYLDVVEQVILQLDTIPIRDRETFVYSPQYIKAEELAPTISEFSEAEQARLDDIGEEVSTKVRQERLVVAIPNEDSNRIIIDVDPRFRDAVMQVVHDLDQPPLQVMIQVLIIEVTMDNSLELGVEFAFQDLEYTKAGPTDTTTFDYVGGTDIGAAGSGLGGFTFTITGADFNFLFRTLQNEGSLEVLSRPQIVAMDNQEAVINVSNSVPYVTGTQTSTTGQISTSVSRQDVGVKLTVTPQINPDGYVRMELEQEVSDQTGSTVDVGPGVTAPVFFTREAQTTVTVKDGETIVLGGLITSRRENREQKVPIIGDIPGLGLLFRNQNDDTSRNELLIVLTPHVIRDVKDFRNVSVAERDQISLIREDTLSSELMGRLKKENEDLRAADDQIDDGLVPRETPGDRDDAGSEQYGPLRPALRPTPEMMKGLVDPDSYDVPVALARRNRPRHLEN